ncbi:TonB-dependent receptor domain-containing protein [Vibrio hippocampi]|uniref:Vitamin B12 transporter BtuB n=1 Tax=Vibrio hippocampi TaxID=654686 RepID=A0ABM8ZEN4_9VIBR|nr:TonB-dependent receptor [Vibrio hippocampi]CAH0524356.1 Vitamin B12 transporter BtuB [Vibrio hippocampi]
MNRSILATAVAGSLLSYTPFFTAQANDALAPSEVMVITANKTPQQIEQVLAPVEVISRDEIDAIQAKSLSEVLRRLPGVQVSNLGGYGQTTELYVRGRSTKNTLVLINGVRIGSATTGAANLSAIPLDGVERIEMIRGTRAAVYGSDAVSGVVNIITTNPNAALNRVKAGYGSFNSYNASASLYFGDEKQGWLNVTATHQESDGYNIQPSSSTPDDKDDDGYRTQYLVIDTGKALNSQWLIKANGYYQTHYVEYDNPYVGTDKTDSDLYSLSLAAQYLRKNLTSEFSLSTNQDQAESYGQGVAASTIKTQRYAVNWNNELALSQQLKLLGGLDWYRDKVGNTSTAMTKDSRDNAALFAGALYQKNRVSLEGNVRYDDNEAFGGYTTYQLGAGYDLTDNLQLIATHGTAFKAPTFNDLYWPQQCWGSYCYQGNPDLNPEESMTSEVAIKLHHQGNVVWLAIYQSQVDEMIASNGSTNVNIDEAEIKGFELAANFYTGAIDHNVSYDYLDAKDKSTNQHLVRRARHSAKWNSSYKLASWRFDLSYLYQGKRYDDTTNTQVLDPYSLVDIAASYQFANGLSLGGKVANLFDEEYETASDYQSPERNYYINAMYEF